MPQLSCGIVGLPNVGKSTLFNALLKKIAAQASNYPFCTIEPNKGVVNVPDERLAVLAQLSKSEKVVPATVTFVDIAGLVKGASKGAGLGNQFLANIRETRVIIHVVRCFEDEQVIHVDGRVDPIADIGIINLELILADLQMVENVLAKLVKMAKGQKAAAETVALLKRVQHHLDKGQPLRSLSLTTEEEGILRPYSFLTKKAVLYVANVSENDVPAMRNQHVEAVETFALGEGARVIPVCAKLEEELAALTPEDAQAYLMALGLKEASLDVLIRTAFQTLSLITFLTTGREETRAWTILKGTTAQEAAGEIHTDIAKGFIRAETIPYADFVACRGRVQAKEAGKARMEGKEYIVQDGDVLLFFH